MPSSSWGSEVALRCRRSLPPRRALPRRPGRLPPPPAGVRAIETSYLVQPYVHTDSFWRERFVLDNWSSLSPAARKDALAELEIAKKDQAFGNGGALLKSIAPKIADPSGRMAAALIALQ